MKFKMCFNGVVRWLFSGDSRTRFRMSIEGDTNHFRLCYVTEQRLRGCGRGLILGSKSYWSYSRSVSYRLCKATVPTTSHALRAIPALVSQPRGFRSIVQSMKMEFYESSITSCTLGCALFYRSTTGVLLISSRRSYTLIFVLYIVQRSDTRCRNADETLFARSRRNGRRKRPSTRGTSDATISSHDLRYRELDCFSETRSILERSATML